MQAEQALNARVFANEVNVTAAKAALFEESGNGHSEAKKDIIVPAPAAQTDAKPTVSIAPTMGAKKLQLDALEGVPATYEDAGDSVAAASAYVLENLIFRTDLPDPATAKRIANETVALWDSSINPGFLQYRKSVAEADDFASLEWMDDPKRPGGCTLIDHRGNEYLDLLGGFGIYSCGHSHPKIIAAVQSQLTKQPLHSQELLDPLRAYCANILKKTLPGELGKDGYVFFTNSGTESVEACLKFAMLSTNRRNFIGVVGAFHGKTMGSLSGTSKAVFRKPFAGMGALLPFQHVKLNDVQALRATFEASKFNGNEIAAFIVEPVIGEGGIHICSPEFMQEARKLCTEYGALMICDEVQSGMGRTGKFWACEHSGVVPDLMAVAKGFGGGVMGAGACIGVRRVMEPLFDNPFIHTTTFGGNPMACTAAIAAMHVTETENLVGNAQARGDWLIAKLNDLKARFPHIIREVRGRGLMLGLEFQNDEIGYGFSKGVFSRGILLSGTLIAARVLRVEPPLTITAEETEIVAERFEATLLAMTKSGIASAPEHVPAALRAIFNTTPDAPFTANASAIPGHTLSAAVHLNPTPETCLDAPTMATGFGGAGISPSAAAAAGSSVHHPVHVAVTSPVAAATAAAPVAAPAAPPAAGPVVAPVAAAPSAGESEDDEVGNVVHLSSAAKLGKSKHGSHRRSAGKARRSAAATGAGKGVSSPVAASPVSGSDEAKLAALRELEGGEEGSSAAAAAATPRQHHHHHRHHSRHQRPHPAEAATGPGVGAPASSSFFLDASTAEAEERLRKASLSSNGSTSFPGPVLTPATGAAVAAPARRAGEEADDEDDEDEDEDDEEDESDVSSVSSTSTESGGMEGADDE